MNSLIPVYVLAGSLAPMGLTREGFDPTLHGGARTAYYALTSPKASYHAAIISLDLVGDTAHQFLTDLRAHPCGHTLPLVLVGTDEDAMLALADAFNAVPCPILAPRRLARALHEVLGRTPSGQGLVYRGEPNTVPG